MALSSVLIWAFSSVLTSDLTSAFSSVLASVTASGVFSTLASVLTYSSALASSLVKSDTLASTLGASATVSFLASRGYSWILLSTLAWLSAGEADSVLTSCFFISTFKTFFSLLTLSVPD